MGAAAPILDWLKLDRAVAAEVRVQDTVSVACSAIEIALVQEGATRRRIAGREVVVPEGYVLVIPRDSERTTTFTTAHYAVALWLGDAMVEQLTRSLEDDPANRELAAGFFLVRSRKIEPLLRALVQELANAPLGTTFAAEGICESIAIEMLGRSRRAAVSTDSRDPRVRSAITQMQSSVGDALSVDDLAKNANMSRFDFSRLFRDEIGEAPSLFFLRVRIARAVELLREGHTSVLEAAIACGFSDFGVFANAFKMQVGVMPHQLLRQARSA